MVSSEARDCAHAVEERHVEVEDGRVGVDLVRELDRAKTIGRLRHDVELGLPLDEDANRLQEVGVVVRKQNADDPGASRRPQVGGHGARLALSAVTKPVDTRTIAIVGASLDLGAGRRGVDMGPSAIRYAGLETRLAELGRSSVDLGNVETAVAEAAQVGNEDARYLEEIKATCERLARLIVEIDRRGEIPLVLGGDHSIALGTLGGLAAAHGPGGVLWLDAHGDLNRPGTSPSGNVHGMSLAAALGLGGPGFESDVWPTPSVVSGRVALVGVRQLDQGERDLLGELEACVFTMSDIDRLGVEKVMRNALEHVAGPNFVHVSLDMDVVDPDAAPGVGTPVRGGLSYREAHLACELIAESGLMGSLEVVEVNPILDRENETAQLAVELVASALGARIL
jgi:arginase